MMAKATYQEEVDYLCQNEFRNNFIKNLAESLEGNTLVLYQYVEKHGKVLLELMRDSKKPVHFISGAIDGESREEIRKLVNESKSSTLLASKGTTSTGVNIVNLNDLIFASPSKSKIQTLQSVGRTIRASETKNSATLYDIADDLQYKKNKNYTLDHFLERAKIYDSEKFSYKIYTVTVKDTIDE